MKYYITNVRRIAADTTHRSRNC